MRLGFFPRRLPLYPWCPLWFSIYRSCSCGCSRISPANMISVPSGPPTREIFTRVAAQARAPVSGSVAGARMAIGFAPRQVIRPGHLQGGLDPLAPAGDRVDPGAVHRESNPSGEEAQIVVVRSGSGQPGMSIAPCARFGLSRPLRVQFRNVPRTPPLPETERRLPTAPPHKRRTKGRLKRVALSFIRF